jgi:hypothetical protein
MHVFIRSVSVDDITKFSVDATSFQGKSTITLLDGRSKRLFLTAEQIDAFIQAILVIPYGELKVEITEHSIHQVPVDSDINVKSLLAKMFD